MRTLLLLTLSAGCGLTQIMSGVISAGGNAPTQVATPTFSPTSGAGACSGSCSITVNDTDSGLSGYAATYCTNASTDCTPGTSYTVPVTFSTSGTHLCAFANATGKAQSATHCETYTVSVTMTVVHSHFCPATTATGQTCTLGFTSSTANQIIIAWYGYDGSAATVAGHSFDDGQSTSYANFGAATHANAAFSFSYGYGFWIGKPSAAITTMTPNFTGGAGIAEYYVLEVSGLTTGTPTDVGLAVGSDGTTSASSVGTPLSGSPASSSELALGFMVDRFRSTQTYSTPTNWTLISTDADATNGATAVIWKQTPISGTPSTTNPVVTSTMGTAANIAISIGVFK